MRLFPLKWGTLQLRPGAQEKTNQNGWKAVHDVWLYDSWMCICQTWCNCSLNQQVSTQLLLLHVCDVVRSVSDTVMNGFRLGLVERAWRWRRGMLLHTAAKREGRKESASTIQLYFVWAPCGRQLDHSSPKPGPPAENWDSPKGSLWGWWAWHWELWDLER